MFQFTHPGRGATDFVGDVKRIFKVSIHAPREGCDCSSTTTAARSWCFNSRTPGGVRHTRPRGFLGDMEFQFTHPGRGATVCICLFGDNVEFQFTHPGRGATRLFRDFHEGVIKFQFTHPGRGATSELRRRPKAGLGFQFTHPGRGATTLSEARHLRHRMFQFTHPGRGATIPTNTTTQCHSRFNSRTPGGVRPSPS